MLSKIYSLPVGEPANDLYEILIDGKKAQAHSARVSAMPFNRHWPGHQRTLDQTEIIPFVGFETDGPVEVRVRTKQTFSSAVVRPSSRGVMPVWNSGEIIFTLPGPGQYSLEIDGEKGALQLFADPPASYTVLDAEDTLYFGPGVHRVGDICLRSGQTVYIDDGAVVYGQIHATDAERIRIVGRGILDHSLMDAEQSVENNEVNPDPVRPSPICLSYCREVTIEGITIRDPAFLALRPIACENVKIDYVKIIGCWRYNSDGMDFINSVHCRVRNSYVRSFDDSLCLKGFYFLHQGQMFHNGRAWAVMDDVVYENCVVWNDWGKALEIGVDLCAMEIRNCAFRNCDIIHCGGSACMDISNVDYAYVHDIAFENIRVEYDRIIQQPTIQLNDSHIFQPDPRSNYMPLLFLMGIDFTTYSFGGTVRGKIESVRFENIIVTAPRMPMSDIHGYDGNHEVKEVIIRNVIINGCRIRSAEEAGIQIGCHVKDVCIE